MFFAYIITRRFLELFGAEVLLSAAFSLLFITGFFPSYTWLVLLISGIEIIAYFVFNVHMLRRCYMAVEENLLYTGLNLVANLIFAAINCVFYLCFSNRIYTWFFGVFKILHYMEFTGIGFSFLILHIIMFLLIFASPFGLNANDKDNLN